MARVRLQQHRVSKSAKELAAALSIPRLKLRNSKFRPRSTDIIVNWGAVSPLPNVTYTNDISAVRTAACKLRTLKQLQESNVSIPNFYTSLEDVEPTTTLVARQTLTGHSGEGIHVAKKDEQVSAPLYTELIPKVREYRAIVCAGEVVDFKQKLKKRDWEQERDQYIWNCDNGYVYARNDIHIPEQSYQLATDATNALGLTYGAVDIIEDDNGNLYVLEINTAFGLEGSTIEKFSAKLKQYIDNLLGEHNGND